jgi:hypothetical protein
MQFKYVYVENPVKNQHVSTKFFVSDDLTVFIGHFINHTEMLNQMDNKLNYIGAGNIPTPNNKDSISEYYFESTSTGIKTAPQLIDPLFMYFKTISEEVFEKVMEYYK